MIAPFDDFRSEAEEVLDLGVGVAFAVVVAKGGIGGAGAEVPFRFASVTIWSAGQIEQQTNYTDIDEAACCRRTPRRGTGVGRVAGKRAECSSLPRHDVRLSDERARLRADEGHARVARLRGGAGARRGRPDPVQHVLDPRDGRQPLHRASRRGETAEARTARSGSIGVGGCWAQSVKEEVFERFPFVDVAFGPGQVHKLAEFLTSDSLTAQGYFEFEGFTGHLPAHRARPFQGWMQISVGCNCALLVLHRALDARARGQPARWASSSPRPRRWPPTACAR